MLGDGLVRCGGRAGETAGRDPGTAPRSDPYYTARPCVNGNEYAKRQATKAGIGFQALDNGFASVDDPAAVHLRQPDRGCRRCPAAQVAGPAAAPLPRG
jgi:hypothetical protein